MDSYPLRCKISAIHFAKPAELLKNPVARRSDLNGVHALKFELGRNGDVCADHEARKSLAFFLEFFNRHAGSEPAETLPPQAEDQLRAIVSQCDERTPRQD